MFARLRSLFRSRDEVGESAFRIPADPHAPWQPEEELSPLPRMVLLMIPKQPYVEWVRRSVPDGAMRSYALADSRRKDRMAFLIPGEGGDLDEAEAFVATHWQHFFAQALSLWLTDPTAWPQDRSLKQFRDWFDVEACDMVLDLGGYADECKD